MLVGEVRAERYSTGEPGCQPPDADRSRSGELVKLRECDADSGVHNGNQECHREPALISSCPALILRQADFPSGSQGGRQAGTFDVRLCTSLQLFRPAMTCQIALRRVLVSRAL